MTGTNKRELLLGKYFTFILYKETEVSTLCIIFMLFERSCIYFFVIGRCWQINVTPFQV